MDNKKDEYAIKIENLSRGYGQGKKVLDDLNAEIEEGTINVLIGASGSGKTTLLRIILGRLYPDEGKVFIFGNEPYGSIDFDYPGSLLGYAPQETALYLELTIDETLSFFGNIHGMNKEIYKKRREEIISLLDLPPKERVVGTLSGGQKRRVSLAISLLHDPKILFLDEPTVGIDPLVSKRIWEHLNYLSKHQNTTIVITTHYIEEARQSDNILMLRGGKIVEKGHPSFLLSKYKCSYLEEVYFKVCAQSTLVEGADYSQNLENETTIDNNCNSTPLGYSGLQEISMSRINNQELEIETKPIKSYIKNINILKKILIHSWSIFKRNSISSIRIKLLFALMILSPTLIGVLFFLTIGGIPHDLNFGILNADTGMAGNIFVDQLNNGNIFNLQNISSIKEGIDKVYSSKLEGFILIPENFTEGLLQRSSNPMGESIPNSEIVPYLDESNNQIKTIIFEKLRDDFVKLSNQSGIKIYPMSDTVQIFEGNEDFISFMGPAIITLIIFAHNILYMVIIIIKEKRDGCIERLYSYGVSPISNLIGYLMTDLIFVFLQHSILLLIGYYAFNMPCKGNIVLIYLYFFLIQMISAAYGIFLSIICTEEVEGVQLAMAIFFTIFFISGVIWPIEAVPNWFQWSTTLIPTNWSSIGLRAIMIKNLPFSHILVWRPFIILISWIIFLYIICLYLSKLRKKNSKILYLLKKLKK